MASPEKIDRLQHRLRNLLRCPELTLGLIAFDRRADVEGIEGARAVGNSLLLCDECAPRPARTEPTPAMREFSRARTRSSFKTCRRRNYAPATNTTCGKHGHRSLLLYPLHVGDQLVGLMELASPKPGDLNAFNARRLLDVVPLFATTLKRNLDELEDHVQALIKRKYTAIHSSVEWRFREAALQLPGGEGARGGKPRARADRLSRRVPALRTRRHARLVADTQRGDSGRPGRAASNGPGGHQCRGADPTASRAGRSGIPAGSTDRPASNPNSGRTTNRAYWSSSGKTWSRYLDNSRPTGVTWPSV